MINSLSLKEVLFVVLVSTTIIACKKKEETPIKEEETPTTPTVTCFNSNNNGAYVGSGVTTFTPFTSGTLTVTRTSCQIVSLNLTTNTAGIINDQASQLVLNSNGAYDGKQNNGNNITLTFGSVLNVNATGSFTFTGSK